MSFHIRSGLFSVFEKATRKVGGLGLGRIPGTIRMHDFLFRRLWPNRNVIEVQGSKMYVDLAGEYMLRRTFESYIIAPDWEALMTRVFKKVVRPGDTVLDLGANLGYYTLLAAKLVGNGGKVFAFEPEPRNYGLLIKNLALNGYDNVVPIQKAISNTSATVRLYLNSDDSGAHTIRPSTNKEFVEVESVALDEFFAEGTRSIDVVKMDIEGAEMAALTGMEKIIRNNPHIKLFVEFYPAVIKEAGHSLEEFANRLFEDFGFSVLALEDYTRSKRYKKLQTAKELVDLCQDGRILNLFLERVGAGAAPSFGSTDF